MTRRHDLEVERDTMRERAFAAEVALERVQAMADTQLGRAERLAGDLVELRGRHLEVEVALAKATETLEAGWSSFRKARVIVNTTDGAAFAGILWDGTGPLILRDGSLLADAGKALPSPQKLDGEVIIDFARVAWVQAPAAADG